MENDRIQKIFEQSKSVDAFWKGATVSDFENLSITYPVPKAHIRFSSIQTYRLHYHSIKVTDFTTEDLIIIDEHLLTIPWLQILLPSQPGIVSLAADETKTKEIYFLNNLLAKIQKKPRIIGIGGGITLNVVGYLAEQLNTDLIYIPTTPISMSDSSIGGKVRVNRVETGRFEKHAYKSFYEPNEVIVDIRFLSTLAHDQLSWGLAEIVKHAIYQSPLLLDYLLSDNFNPKVSEDLLKAILWCADLKRICIEVDPEEEKGGSYTILRAGHDVSDKIEEQSHFTTSHGEAVWKGIEYDLKTDPIRYIYFQKLQEKLFS